MHVGVDFSAFYAQCEPIKCDQCDKTIRSNQKKTTCIKIEHQFLMVLSVHASKCSSQNSNEILQNMPLKGKKSKIPKISDSPMKTNKNDKEKDVKLEDIHALILVMNDMIEDYKFDMIEDQIVEMKTDLNAVKHSVEFVHEEIGDLKKENERKTIKKHWNISQNWNQKIQSYTMPSLISKQGQCGITCYFII